MKQEQITNVKYYYHQTPVGDITIIANDKYLLATQFTKIKYDYEYGKNFIIEKTIQQLNEYFLGKRKQFDIPYLLIGTDFQKQVWNSLTKIPYGETKSYQDIAIEINNKNAVRAVGMANNKNNISIIIPCHRVIGKNNKLVGYGGGLKIKEYLLNLERNK